MKPRIPKSSPPEVKLADDDKMITEIRKYKLITPLFGGGVEAQKADPITVIRGTSVRGQLRFWWRATRGGQFGDIKTLLKEEGKIWGSPAVKSDKNSGPSDVTITINTTNKGKRFPVVDRKGNAVANIGSQDSIYSYIAFPLRERTDAVVLQDIEFELTIQYPATEKDIQAALWAWENFGGIGARTRRGFGALQLISIYGREVRLPKSDEIQKYIAMGLAQHLKIGHTHQGVPLLMHSSIMSILTSKKLDAVQTWRFLFDKMKAFRQSRYKDKNGNPYGLSKWPEPDSIRRITKDHSIGHEPKHPVVGKFPRAQFGLPIILKFKESDEKNGDPSTSTLKPCSSERWASPLILRPITCSDGYIGLAIRFSSRLSDIDDGVVLENGQSNYKAEWGLNNKDAAQIEPLSGKADVLQAFLDYLTK